LVSRKQGATVTVVNVGGPETEPTKKALAIGANDAIRVNATTDGFFVAKQLAEVIKMVNMILL
jgi:electron transfer flavoprotein beta subunit